MPVLAASMLSPWIVLPLAAVTMVVVAGHVLSVQRAEMPDVRRRLRTAAGLLMLFVAGLMGYALGIMPGPVHGDAASGRTFLVAWVLVATLVFFILVLAIADMLYTLHLGATMKRELHRQAMDDIASVTDGRPTSLPPAREHRRG